MHDYVHKTRLGALKSSLVWKTVKRGEEWQVEEYTICKLRARYYISDLQGHASGPHYEIFELADAFAWIADHLDKE